MRSLLVTLMLLMVMVFPFYGNAHADAALERAPVEEPVYGLTWNTQSVVTTAGVITDKTVTLQLTFAQTLNLKLVVPTVGVPQTLEKGNLGNGLQRLYDSPSIGQEVWVGGNVHISDRLRCCTELLSGVPHPELLHYGYVDTMGLDTGRVGVSFTQGYPMLC